jgi:ketosteroid isomerase-like protein
MSQENVEIVRRGWDLFTERIDQGDPATASDAAFDQGLFAPTSTLTPAREVPPHKTYVGREGYAEFLRAWLEDFMEWRIGLEKIIDPGDDRVVAVVRQSARGKGSGAPVELQFTIVYTLKDGQIIGERHYLDVREALEAVGLSEQDAHADS